MATLAELARAQTPLDADSVDHLQRLALSIIGRSQSKIARQYLQALKGGSERVSGVVGEPLLLAHRATDARHQVVERADQRAQLGQICRRRHRREIGR